MMSEYIKPLSMENDTFEKIKRDMTASMNALLVDMQEFGADDASMTVNLSITLGETVLEDGSRATVPVFDYKVSSAVQVKHKREGKIGGEYMLLPDAASGTYKLAPLAQQMRMD